MWLDLSALKTWINFVIVVANFIVAIISSSISSSLLLLLLLCCYYNISAVRPVCNVTWIQQKRVSDTRVLVSLFSHVLCLQEYIWKENYRMWLDLSALKTWINFVIVVAIFIVAIISSSISSSLLLFLLLCCYYNISAVRPVCNVTWIQQKRVSESRVLVSLFSHVLCPQEYIWKENSCHKWWIIKSAVNCRICWWKGNEQTKKRNTNMRCAQPKPVHSIALAK